ncbi:DUF4240 domain-containing protein [Streptomyces sp. NPDC016845]|uniref:DUF4240 domain-containing protein n=1 Tax=Streptomyces sp. NPDC016845 TaxID=3364972 RepID=UPI0037B8D157
MDMRQFWDLIEQARQHIPAPADTDAIAQEATALLASRPLQAIIGTHQAVYQLLADSYRAPLWAAAYMINGGCSDDGFDYFRGWLIMQGRTVFEQVLADPDTLADNPAVREAAPEGYELECEDALGIAWHAHLAATGGEIPDTVSTARYPDLDPAWDFDFDDSDELARRLPRLAALYE